MPTESAHPTGTTTGRPAGAPAGTPAIGSAAKKAPADSAKEERASAPALPLVETRSPAVIRRGLLRCAAAGLLEVFAFSAFLSGHLGWATALPTVLVHAGACALTAEALHSMMPLSQQQPRRSGLLFLFAITFFMPPFGMFGMLGGLIAELYFPNRPPPPSPWLSVEFPELPHQPPTVAAQPEYGDGALSAMLRYCPTPERRLAAVLAVRHLRDQNDTYVLRLALTDPVDDVRLLAYSILDRKEQSFSAQHKSFLTQLESAREPGKRAKLQKRIAQTHLEMIKLGLAKGEVQSYLLAEGRRHVDAALQVAPDDRESLFLLGIIALRQDDLPTAEKAFLKAQVLGMALEKVLPYLAELAFRQQRFSMVAHYLRAIDPLYFHTQPLLGSVASLWLEGKPSWRSH